MLQKCYYNVEYTCDLTCCKFFYLELYTCVGESKVKEKHEIKFLSSIIQNKTLYVQKTEHEREKTLFLSSTRY